VQTDRGALTAPLIVDALGWRRVLSNAAPIQPPRARLSRALEVHPDGRSEEMQLWIDPRYVRAGYSWSFPAGEELRVGVGSFWPSHHVKEPTVRLARDLELPAKRYQGNWIPHQLRAAVEDEVFFVGDSAGHCLPLTAEGIRTALYFGLACGRELRAVLDGRSTRAQALARYGGFSSAHARKFRWLLAAQRAVGAITPSRALTTIVGTLESRRLAGWIFDQYLAIAPPSFVDGGGAAGPVAGTTAGRRPRLSRSAPGPRRELQIAHVDPHQVHRLLEQRSAEAVTAGEDPLGVELPVRGEHFGGGLQRRSEGPAASRAGGEQDACVATQAFDLARAALGAHVEVAARRRCPHRGRYGRAVATVADQQRALGGATVGQGARARRLRD